MSKREDVHRPSAINPGEYALTGNVFDLKYDDLETMEVGTKPYGHCNHCGKAIRWAVEFTYAPTGEVVVFGEQCADILSLSDSRTKHELVLLKRAVRNLELKQRLKGERDDNYRFFKTRNPEIVEQLENLDPSENNYFIKDLARNLEKFGMLTENQVTALKRVLEQRHQRFVEKMNEVQPTTPVNEGRVEMKGEVVSTKWQFNAYTGDDVKKMLVKLTDNNKVWGTVPANIIDVDRGDLVHFTATVEANKDDEHFGYFKRPAKATFRKKVA
jgi:predicted nucleic acid-binding Zn ribbon protein